ncbi:MAG: hypothetical protein Fur0024_2770 [Patescibacteria group bacterium]
MQKGRWELVQQRKEEMMRNLLQAILDVVKRGILFNLDGFNDPEAVMEDFYQVERFFVYF